MPLVQPVLAFLETGQLFLGTDVQPELGNDGAMQGEFLLKLVDFPVGPLPLVGADASAAQSVRVDLPLGAEHPHEQLLVARKQVPPYRLGL